MEAYGRDRGVAPLNLDTGCRCGVKFILLSPYPGQNPGNQRIGGYVGPVNFQFSPTVFDLYKVEQSRYRPGVAQRVPES